MLPLHLIDPDHINALRGQDLCTHLRIPVQKLLYDLPDGGFQGQGHQGLFFYRIEQHGPVVKDHRCIGLHLLQISRRCLIGSAGGNGKPPAGSLKAVYDLQILRRNPLVRGQQRAVQIRNQQQLLYIFKHEYAPPFSTPW